MKKICIILLITFLFCQKNSAQIKDRKVYYFLSVQADKTLYDYTIRKNKGGTGLGLQLNFQTKRFFKPIIELNVDGIGGPKESIFFLGGSTSVHESKSIISSAFIGSIFILNKHLSSSLTLGSSFFSNKAHFGIRPSLSYYPSKNQKWNTKLSFTHVPFKDEFTNQDFGYLSFSVGINPSQ